MMYDGSDYINVESTSESRARSASWSPPLPGIITLFTPEDRTSTSRMLLKLVLLCVCFPLIIGRVGWDVFVASAKVTVRAMPSFSRWAYNTIIVPCSAFMLQIGAKVTVIAYNTSYSCFQLYMKHILQPSLKALGSVVGYLWSKLLPWLSSAFSRIFKYALKVSRIYLEVCIGLGKYFLREFQETWWPLIMSTVRSVWQFQMAIVPYIFSFVKTSSAFFVNNLIAFIMWSGRIFQTYYLIPLKNLTKWALQTTVNICRRIGPMVKQQVQAALRIGSQVYHILVDFLYNKLVPQTVTVVKSTLGVTWNHVLPRLTKVTATYVLSPAKSTMAIYLRMTKSLTVFTYQNILVPLTRLASYTSGLAWETVHSASNVIFQHVITPVFDLAHFITTNMMLPTVTFTKDIATLLLDVTGGLYTNVQGLVNTVLVDIREVIGEVKKDAATMLGEIFHIVTSMVGFGEREGPSRKKQ